MTSFQFLKIMQTDKENKHTAISSAELIHYNSCVHTALSLGNSGVFHRDANICQMRKIKEMKTVFQTMYYKNLMLTEHHRQLGVIYNFNCLFCDLKHGNFHCYLTIMTKWTSPTYLYDHVNYKSNVIMKFISNFTSFYTVLNIKSGNGESSHYLY